MTIRFLKPWNGYQPDAVVSGLTNEAALIAGGLASYDLDGGNDGRTYEAKLATDASGNVMGLVGPDGLIAIGRVLAQSHTDASKSDANTDESILFSYTIPGKLLGPNDSLVIRCIWEFTNSAVNKNRRVRLGGISGTQMQYDASGASVLGFVDEIFIANRGATNSQISSRVLGNSAPFGSQSAGSYATASKDMTVDQDLVITGAWATAGAGTANITLKSAIVIYLPGAV